MSKLRVLFLGLYNSARSQLFPGAAVRLHWGMPDPSAVQGNAEEKRGAFQRTADALQARLSEFLQTLSALPR
jgi:arsenate reductase